MGLQLVTHLVDQLEGKLEVERGNAPGGKSTLQRTLFTITFAPTLEENV